MFTLTVNNAGPSDATGVFATDVLPSGYTFVSSSATVGTYDESTGIWTIGNLANGATETLDITVNVNAAGDYTNSASVEGDQPDPDSPDDEDTPDDPVIPVPQADLSIVKTIDNTTPNVGEDVVFTITVTNDGPSAATNVVATDDLPSGYTFVSATSTVGSYDENTGDWIIGTMANGAVETLEITVTVNPTGDYANTATVSSDTDDPDPTPGDEEDTETPIPNSNRPPIANDDPFTIDEDTELIGNLLPNDEDPDGDDLVINTVPVDGPDHGTLVINPDGSFSYTPDEDYVGSDTFVYEVCDDGVPAKCDQATVTITVEENRSIDIEVNEVCLSDVPYVEYTITAVGFTPTNGATITWKKMDGTIAEQNTDQPLTGMLLWPGAKVDADGKPTDWPGWDLVDGIWVQIADGLRPEMMLEVSINPTKTVTVSYPPATPNCSANPNNSPIANDDPFETTWEEIVSGNLITNDEDPDGDNLIINPIPIDGPDHGTLVINPDGSFTYTPEDGFVGTDIFIYEVCDDAVSPQCDQATVEIVVLKPNTTPEALPDSYQVQNCIFVNGNVLDNDSDPDNDNLVVGMIPEVDPTNGTVTISPDGSFRYTPNNGYVGTDSFTYMLCDNAENQKCTSGEVTIDVIAPLDSDQDGLLDCDEIGDDPDNPIDTDGDGLPDYNDPDDDNDGIPTAEELDDPEDDCDEDGIPNYLDDAQYSCGDLPVSTIVTPNNDGFNEFMRIDGLDEFDDNSIIVYNRWGNVVFEVDGYTSDPADAKTFTGSSNVRNSAQNLPDGAYFYVLKLVRNGKERVQKGSFEIRN